jgi:hypothetical protein
MAHATEIDDLLEHVTALERCALALAREQDGGQQMQQSVGAATARAGGRAMRASVRRFPLLAFAGAFSLGLCIASRLHDRALSRELQRAKSRATTAEKRARDSQIR